MSGTKTRIEITHGDETVQSLKDILWATNGDTDQQMAKLSAFFAAVGSGLRQATVVQSIDDSGTDTTDKATATATFVYATLANNDTEIIGGTTVTCVTGTPTAVQYKKETDLATTIANFAAMINAHATLSAVVRAVVTDTGVVTLYAKLPGVSGNFITCASGVGTGVTWGAAALAGGVTTGHRTFTR